MLVEIRQSGSELVLDRVELDEPPQPGRVGLTRPTDPACPVPGHPGLWARGLPGERGAGQGFAEGHPGRPLNHEKHLKFHLNF